VVLRWKWIARVTAIFIAANIAAIYARMRDRIPGLVGGSKRVLRAYLLDNSRVYVESHVWPLSKGGADLDYMGESGVYSLSLLSQ
jgi:hypothetical protein